VSQGRRKKLTEYGKPGRRLSYAVHWVRIEGESNIPESRIFDDLDQRLAEFVSALRRNAYIMSGPIVERIVHTDLTSTEKKRLERMAV
jgi:hypothetical protein